MYVFIGMFYVTYGSYCGLLFVMSLSWWLLVLPFPHTLELQSVVLVGYQCDLDTPLFETLQGCPTAFRGRSMLLSIAWRPLHLPTPAWAFLSSLHWHSGSFFFFCLESHMPTSPSPLLPLEIANSQLLCRSPLQPTHCPREALPNCSLWDMLPSRRMCFIYLAPYSVLSLSPRKLYIVYSVCALCI